MKRHIDNLRWRLYVRLTTGLNAAYELEEMGVCKVSWLERVRYWLAMRAIR